MVVENGFGVMLEKKVITCRGSGLNNCWRTKIMWQSVGTRLISTVKAAAKDKGVTQTLVVCGAHDHPKRKFLSEQNLQVTSEWFIGGIV
jgi:hypothetical protein